MTEEYKEGFYPYQPWDLLADRDDEDDDAT